MNNAFDPNAIANAGQPPPQAGPPAEGAAAPPVNDIAAALTAAVKAGLQQAPQQPQAPPPMTQEQIDQYLQTFRANETLAQRLFGESATPQHVEALNELITGIVRNAYAMADFRSQGHILDYHNHVNPYLEDARELAQERFYENIYKGHDGLKQFDPFIKEMIPQFEGRPDYPKTRAERAEYVRKQAVDLIKQANPQFDPTKGAAAAQPASGQQTQQTQPNRSPQSASLPSFGGGSQGAAAQAAGGQSQSPSWDTNGFGF